MKWFLAVSLSCVVSYAEWKESAIEGVVLVSCTSSSGIFRGSGVVIDPHVVVTAGHAIEGCKNGRGQIEVLDNAEESRTPDHFMYRNYGDPRGQTLVRSAIAMSQDEAFLVFEKTLQTRPLFLATAEDYRSATELLEGEFTVVGFPYSFKGQKAEGHFTRLRRGSIRALRWMLAKADRNDLLPALGDLLLEVEIDKKSVDHFLPGISGGAVLDSRTGRVVGLAVGFFDDIHPQLKFGVAINFTHPMRSGFFQVLKERYPLVLKNSKLDFANTHTQDGRVFAKSLAKLYRALP